MEKRSREDTHTHTHARTHAHMHTHAHTKRMPRLKWKQTGEMYPNTYFELDFTLLRVLQYRIDLITATTTCHV